MSKAKSPLVIIFITVFIDLVGFGIIIPLSPYLAREYGASGLEVGLLMAVYSLMQFFFSPLWGRWSDKIGRRPIILISLFGAALSHAAFAFAETLTVLFIARTFAGIFGANISAASAYIADVTEKKDRSKNMGIIGAAFGMGFIFGPAIGGLTADWGHYFGDGPPFGMGFPALVASVISFGAFLFAIKALPESLKPEDRTQPRDMPHRFKMIFQYVTKETVGAILLVSFIFGISMAQMEATLALFVKEGFDWTLRQTSFAFAYIGVMIAFTQGYLIRKLMPKFGERKLLVVGTLMAAVGMFGISQSAQVWHLGVAITLLALGNGLFSPTTMGSLSLLSKTDEQGRVMGVQHSFSALSRVIGPALGGYIFDKLGMTSPYLTSAIGMFICFLLILMIYKSLPQEGQR